MASARPELCIRRRRARDLRNNGYGVIDSGTKSADTDGDGMPDYWELAMGTIPPKMMR